MDTAKDNITKALTIGAAIVILVAFLTIIVMVVAPEIKARAALAVLYLNQEKVTEKILSKIQAFKKIKYCTKTKYGTCISEPFELKEDESLGLVSYRLAIINDDSSYRILPSFHELLDDKWYCCDNDECKPREYCCEPPFQGDIGFMIYSEKGRWRLFMPDGSIKIADEKATFVFYTPEKYETFGGLFDYIGFSKWATKLYKDEVLKMCSDKDIKKYCSFSRSLFLSVEDFEELSPEITEKIISYAVENLADVFLHPYKKTFFKIKGTKEYVAGHSLLKVEKKIS